MTSHRFIRAWVVACSCWSGFASNAILGEEPPVVELRPQLREACLTVLHAVFRGDEFWPAMHAAEGLTLAGAGDAIVPALEERLKSETDHQKRCGLVREIVRTGKREPLGILFATLADPTSNGRVHAAESLYKIAELHDGELMRKVFRESGSVRLQLMAAAALGRAGSDEALRTIRAALKSDDREIRKIAVWILGLIGAPRDVTDIEQVLQGESDQVAKAYCVNALACLGNARAKELLGQNLAAADPAVRTYSAEFAGYSGCTAFHTRLVEMLRDDTADVRARAAQSLIVHALPSHTLGLPLHTADDVRADVFPASNHFPRYSEGSVIPLRDGSLLYATTEFGEQGADHATATLVAKSSRDGGRSWGPQRTIQENIGKQNVMSVTLRRMRPAQEESPLGMFFLVKNSSTDLKVVLRLSPDDGQSFAPPITVTSSGGYHVMNNDRVTILRSGRIICPVATAQNVTSKNASESHFVCRCFYSDDQGATWAESQDTVDHPQRGAMEPEVVELADHRLMMIVRTQSGFIATSVSSDAGVHWSNASRLPLDAPEAPSTIRTIPSTGDLLLLWNASADRRTPLASAISTDQGKTWKHVRQLESDPARNYAYTSVCFHKDRVMLTYYVHDPVTKQIASRFRSLPVRWFYEAE